MPASAGVGNHFPQFQQVHNPSEWSRRLRHSPGVVSHLKTDPKVHIQIRDEHLEHKCFWPKLIRLYPPYRGYRKQTDRLIPLVLYER